MKSTGKAASVAKKKVCISKAKTTKNGAVPPFAHRTPTQLHASTYALRRG